MPTDTVAVMMPKSMTFEPGPGAPYTPVTEGANSAEPYVARGVQPSQALDFMVSGTGQMHGIQVQGAGDGGGSGWFGAGGRWRRGFGGLDAGVAASA